MTEIGRKGRKRSLATPRCLARTTGSGATSRAQLCAAAWSRERRAGVRFGIAAVPDERFRSRFQLVTCPPSGAAREPTVSLDVAQRSRRCRSLSIGHRQSRSGRVPLVLLFLPRDPENGHAGAPLRSARAGAQTDQDPIVRARDPHRELRTRVGSRSSPTTRRTRVRERKARRRNALRRHRSSDRSRLSAFVRGTRRDPSRHRGQTRSCGPRAWQSRRVRLARRLAAGLGESARCVPPQRRREPGEGRRLRRHARPTRRHELPPARPSVGRCAHAGCRATDHEVPRRGPVSRSAGGHCDASLTLSAQLQGMAVGRRAARLGALAARASAVRKVDVIHGHFHYAVERSIGTSRSRVFGATAVVEDSDAAPRFRLHGVHAAPPNARRVASDIRSAAQARPRPSTGGRAREAKRPRMPGPPRAGPRRRASRAARASGSRLRSASVPLPCEPPSPLSFDWRCGRSSNIPHLVARAARLAATVRARRACARRRGRRPRGGSARRRARSSRSRRRARGCP